MLFDDIEAEQVAAQRKLFQAQATPVQLACSATNCYSYEVFVWRKKLVLASNNWHSSLMMLPAADRAWIQANSIVLDINEPMWCERGEGLPRGGSVGSFFQVSLPPL